MSAKKIGWLQSTGRRYVIGTPRSELKAWERQLTERDGWMGIREDIEVKICPGPDGVETFLLCRSASRAEKEKAMHARFSERIEQGLLSLKRRMGGPRSRSTGARRSVRSGACSNATAGLRAVSRSP